MRKISRINASQVDDLTNLLEKAIDLGLLPEDATNEDLTSEIRKMVLEPRVIEDAVDLGLLPEDATNEDLTSEIHRYVLDFKITFGKY